MDDLVDTQGTIPGLTTLNKNLWIWIFLIVLAGIITVKDRNKCKGSGIGKRKRQCGGSTMGSWTSLAGLCALIPLAICYYGNCLNGWVWVIYAYLVFIFVLLGEGLPIKRIIKSLKKKNRKLLDVRKEKRKIDHPLLWGYTIEKGLRCAFSVLPIYWD